jgi:hypothetical protein
VVRKPSWLQVRVVGNAGSNRAAIGAMVFVETPSKTRLRHVQGGTGKGCQDSLYLHFGLGSQAQATRIRVRFVGGKEVTFEGPFASGYRYWLYEDGTKKQGWTAD